MIDIIGTINTPSSKYSKYITVNPGAGTFLSNILTLIFVFTGILILINTIIAGFLYITSAGDPQKIKQAGDKIYSSLIGLVVVVASSIISALLGELLFHDPSALINFTLFYSN